MNFKKADFKEQKGEEDLLSSTYGSQLSKFNIDRRFKRLSVDSRE